MFDSQTLSTRFAFPGGKWKALLLSFDDGNVQDRRLVELFNRCGLRGTFNLNSGKLGKVETWDRTYSYVSTDEVRTLYAGHEVACHTVDHPYLTELASTAIKFEVGQDKRNLEGLTGVPVRGMAYPFNSYNDAVIALLPSQGILYSRAGWGGGGFDLPENPLAWEFTCHYSQVSDYTERFLALPAGRMAIYSVGGHSWEMDSSVPAMNWSAMEEFCKTMGGRDDVWPATMGEIYDYLVAISEVKFSRGGKTAENLSGVPVWMNTPSGVVEIPAGGRVDF